MEIWQARAIRRSENIVPLSAQEPQIESRQLVLHKMLNILLLACPNIQMKYAEILLNIFTQHMRILMQKNPELEAKTEELDAAFEFYDNCAKKLKNILEDVILRFSKCVRWILCESNM